MKKEIVLIVTVLILIAGISSIYVILNPVTPSDFDNIPTNDIDDDYALVKENKIYKEYLFKEGINLDLYIENFNIVYKDKSLKINDKKIIDDAYLYPKAALYKDAKLVLFTKSASKETGSYIIYNTLNDTFKIVSEIDKMYVVITNNIYFEETGFTLNLSSVFKDKFISNNKSICNINDNRIVNKYIEVYFDPNSLEFNDYEEFSSLNLNGYKNNNDYCEK